jgi:hypothetical protein
MADALIAFAAVVDASAFGQWARSSALAYPIANVAHVLGLVLLVGAIGLLDIRLAGGFRTLPVLALAQATTPIAVAGLAVMLASGATLFAADAPALATSAIFGWKLALVGLALCNAAAFRLLWQRRFADWDAGAPAVARLMAGCSLLLWLGVAVAGRLIAYL